MFGGCTFDQPSTQRVFVYVHPFLRCSDALDFPRFCACLDYICSPPYFSRSSVFPFKVLFGMLLLGKFPEFRGLRRRILRILQTPFFTPSLYSHHLGLDSELFLKRREKHPGSKEIALYFFESSLLARYFCVHPLVSLCSQDHQNPLQNTDSGSYFFLLLYSGNSLSSEHSKREFRESFERPIPYTRISRYISIFLLSSHVVLMLCKESERWCLDAV